MTSLYLLIVGVEVIAAPNRTVGHTHSVELVYTSYWPVAETCTCTTHNIRKKQTSVHSAGFKPRNSSKQAAADLDLRPRDHRNRPEYCQKGKISENNVDPIKFLVLKKTHVCSCLVPATYVSWFKWSTCPEFLTGKIMDQAQDREKWLVLVNTVWTNGFHKMWVISPLA